MDSVKLSSMTPKKSRLARTVAKVLHLRAATGIAPVDGVQKVKSQEKVKDDKKIGNKSTVSLRQSFKISSDEEHQRSLAMEALLAKLFASISSVKAAYAQLQCAQSPYDVDGIQAADKLVVSELKNLAELKQCYIKKQFDNLSETTMLLAEVQEQKCVSKTYEIMGKKLESQLRLKDSEIIYLKEKLEESNRQNQLLEKRLNQSGQLLCLTIFTDQMKATDWNLEAAANSIVADVVYWRADDKCFAFECFVCREMFDGFNLPNFSLPSDSLPERKNKQRHFFRRFTELKSVKAKEYLAEYPKSTFAKFCRAKYLQLVHPQMETSFFGNLSQRSIVNSSEFPDTNFFASFAEMARGCGYYIAWPFPSSQRPQSFKYAGDAVFLKFTWNVYQRMHCFRPKMH
ncbi:hypothetical protein GH714_025938 [Hevea brasiliensis]|uniref:DUF641 domain-containing protein n=1 Tax=Hevea brasiliensis TaxID=3981 RepID=A0A6A6MKW9_HEVBR|nr:hypothetical protein GH714_025938 [Hevea brasiliensis]